jgi:hypothetical protein
VTTQPFALAAPNLQSILPSNNKILEVVTRHLQTLFEPDDRICLTFIKRSAKIADNLCVPLVTAITKTTITEIQARNQAGEDVYVAMNPILPGANDRQKVSAGTPRNVFMEVDDEGDKVLAAVRSSVAVGEIPEPSVILCSSPGKYQFIWRINADEFALPKVESLNEALVQKFGADPACTDFLRLLRVPNFTNHKYPERPVVEVVSSTPGRLYGYNDFKITIEAAKENVARPVAADDELSGIVEYFEQAAEEAHLSISRLKKWGNNGYLWELTCPWVEEHTGKLDTGTVVILHKSGALDFCCRHSHCRNRNWPKDFRPYLEDLVGHGLRFGDPVGEVILNTVQTVSMDVYKTDGVSAAAPATPATSEPVPDPEHQKDGGPVDVAAGSEDPAVAAANTDWTVIPPFDVRILTGFYADVVELVTRNNTLPPQLVYGIVKTLVGARCSGVTKFQTTTAEPRYYFAAISLTGGGKGECYRRTMEVLRHTALIDPSLCMKIYDSADSGAGLKEVFFEDPTGQPVVIFIDEVADLGFKSQANKNPEILSTMLSLAESTTVSRVLADKRKTRNDARLSVVMCGQPDIYPSAFSGIKGGVLGWYDRLTPEFAELPSTLGELAPIDPAEACAIHKRFNALPYPSEVAMSAQAQHMIDEFWNSLLLEQRIARRRKNLIIDCYMAAFGRGAKEVETDDVWVALRLFERQQVIRYIHFCEEVPDRIGFYQSKIKKITEQMADDIRKGKAPEFVRMTRRLFEKHTRAYQNNEGHIFQRAWAVFAPVYLNKVVEKNSQGREVEWFLPKWRS